MDFANFKPCFLIAMPELSDPHFAKSVVLLTDYNDTGASGFVINRPTNMNLGETIILPDGNLNSDYQNLILWYGGPVDPQKIWVVYDRTVHSDETDTNLGEHIGIARSIDLLINHEKTVPPERLRVFHGYAGWAAKQLENEIALSAWITCPLKRDLIFDTPHERIWDTAIRGLGFDPVKLVGARSVFLH